ncbi:MAG TPA: hydrogenase formation protein HypD, partial [Terriglobales bacterium]
MKYVNEYRERAAVQDCVREILVETTRPWTLMEVCGGQTHSIVKYGLDELLKRKITFLHGPGCPVCVTSRGLIDQAVEIAARPEVI